MGSIGAARPTAKNEVLWDYPEIKERIDELELAYKRARSVNKINAIAKSLRAQDKYISDEIDRQTTGNESVKGDMATLLTQRRRVRQLIKQAVI